MDDETNSARLVPAETQAPAPARGRRDTTLAYARLSLAVHTVKFRRQSTSSFGQATEYLPPQDSEWQDLLAVRPAPPRRRKSAPAVSREDAEVAEAISGCLHRLAKLCVMARELPPLAWDGIQDEFDRRGTALERACVAAGPLEDLLVIHGMSFIGKVERRAHADREFAAVLHTVWRSGMDHAVWKRLQRLLRVR